MRILYAAIFLAAAVGFARADGLNLTDAEFDQLVDQAISATQPAPISQPDNCKTWVDCKIEELKARCPGGTKAVIDVFVYGHGPRLDYCLPTRDD